MEINIDKRSENGVNCILEKIRGYNDGEQDIAGSFYGSEEIMRYISDIRMLISDDKGSLSDEKALEIIEEYVFSIEKAHMCCHGDNAKLIERLFLTLRSEMDILQPFVEDKSISEIMINGKDDIFAERNGVLERLPVAFDDTEDLEELIRRIAAKVHREINELNPIVEEMIRRETVTEEAAEFMDVMVKAGYNCFICGGTSSGKTTMLNVLSQLIPSDERVVVIEDSAELQIKQLENIVRLECRNANVQGKGEVDMSQLVKASLRMRPDRIIIGEVRGKEVMDMVQALNTGHSGSLSTGHANSIRGMLKRLEAMFLQAADVPSEAIRSQITEGIDIMIHMSRMHDGTRKVMEIAELEGMADGNISTNTLFRYIPQEKDGEYYGGKLVRSGRGLIHREKLLISRYEI